MIKLSHLRKVSSKKTSPSIMQCPPLSLGSKKRQSTHFTRFPYRKRSNVFICWLVLTGAKNGSLSNALKSTSKSGVSSCCGVVKNSLFVTLSGKGRVIVGSSRTSSRKCARSMTASSCSIKVRSKSVNRSREVYTESPLLLKPFGDCVQKFELFFSYPH